MSDARFEALLASPAGESRRTCPACVNGRKRYNQSQRTLAVNNLGDRIVYHCWHCGAADVIKVSKTAPPPPPTRKAPPMKKEELTPLTEAALNYLASRNISKATAQWAGCMSSTIGRYPAIAFRYPGGEGYKIKALDKVEGKRLQRITGVLKGLYLQDLIGTLPGIESIPSSSIDSSSRDSLEELSLESLPQLRALPSALSSVSTRAIITEGEEDALSCIEAGLVNAMSLPHGAINEKSQNPDNSKLACIDQPDLWRHFKRILVATDADGPGRATMHELARRLGRWRSFLVNFPAGCKDSNDVLVNLGPAGLVQVMEAAEACKVEGLYDAEAFAPDLMRLRRGEMGKGESTGFPSLDPFFRLAPGITVVTGWPKSGKSDFVDQVNVNLAERLGWKTVYWSPENPPAVHIAKLCEKVARARFFPDMPNQMSEVALERSRKLVQEHFKFVSLGTASTIDAILERFSAAVSQFGIRSAVIDPYNAIAWPDNVTREDQFIVNLLNKARDWVNAHECHLWFVAHPKGDSSKGAKVVNGHNISGGPVWWAKCDFGLTVHRLDHNTEVHVWAARHPHLGGHGMGSLWYEYKTASFNDADAFEIDRGPKLVYSNDEFD